MMLLPLAASAQVAPHQAPSLRIDSSQSHAEFGVRLIWFQTIHGRFEDVQGGVHIEPRQQRARITARIAVASVQVDPAHYRKRLLSPTFFAAHSYPYIQFVSDPLSIARLRHVRHLHGQLRLHGVTRPLSLQVRTVQCPHTGLSGCTFHLRGWLDRTRFGMRAHRTLVSSRVTLNLVIRIRAGAPVTPAPARSAAAR